MSDEIVTVKINKSTRHTAKVNAAKNGVTMIQFFAWAVESLAIDEELLKDLALLDAKTKRYEESDDRTN